MEFGRHDRLVSEAIGHFETQTVTYRDYHEGKNTLTCGEAK